MQELFCQARKFFFCSHLKNERMSFLGLTSRHLGPLLLKSRGVWGWFYPKNFSKTTFFVFWATQLVTMSWVICPQVPMKQIRRKSAVCYCIRPKPSDFIIISLRYGRAKLHWRRIQRCNLGGPAQWWRLWMVSRGPSIYYVSIWTGWVGSQNGHFCWRSVLYLCWRSEFVGPKNSKNVLT